ncbi:unnamed protein product [Prorocentrum cordatum]|uniref:Uncharacterized protein n=1 Tax=Prorocentrum cordatum TaxID=2364126 RepID=A0ABN9PXK0_9DINO|nr:unnamed protein product [Polarella glacialis]
MEGHEAVVFGTVFNADVGDSARAEQEAIIDQVLCEEQQQEISFDQLQYGYGGDGTKEEQEAFFFFFFFFFFLFFFFGTMLHVDRDVGGMQKQEAIINQVLYEDGGDGAGEKLEDIVIDQVLYDDGDSWANDGQEAIFFDAVRQEDGDDRVKEDQEAMIDQKLYDDGYDIGWTGATGRRRSRKPSLTMRSSMTATTFCTTRTVATGGTKEGQEDIINQVLYNAGYDAG